MKTILITGIGGLTPRSIATIIRENHPDYTLKRIKGDIEQLHLPTSWRKSAAVTTWMYTRLSAMLICTRA
ncbi:MAG: hypothetical protein KBI01_09290 [Oscillospiraceae bacterium]|nr:hypothetical protein [Oscillospiraceae bacterium]